MSEVNPRRPKTLFDGRIRGPSDRNYRADIQGLRAVAVLGVVLYHADVPGLSGGYVGVDVFFVISGFLITGRLWREVSTSGTVKLRTFYGARARRLLPASATVGAVTMIGSAILLGPLQVQSVGIDGVTSALHVSNYGFISSGVNYFGRHELLSPSPFQHYWSLGVEEQFYLVWPILILGTAWLMRRTGRTASARPYFAVLTIVAVVAFTLSLAFTYLIPPVAFFSLPTRAWQLAVGGLVALTVGRWRRLSTPSAALAGWTGLALILVSYHQFNATTSYPGIAALLPTLGSALVVGANCAAPSWGCGRLLVSSSMESIGAMSYSWYLWHWPVLVLTPALLGHSLGLSAKVAAIVFAAGLAALTVRFIEDPVRFGTRLRRSATGSLALGGAVTAVAVSVCVVVLVAVPDPVGHGPPAPPTVITTVSVPRGSSVQTYDAEVHNVFAHVHAAVAASLALKSVPSNLNPPLTDQLTQQTALLTHGCLLVLPFDDEQPECAAGDLDSTTRVALIGDSRAAMLNPAFRQVSEQRHWRLEMMAKAGCSITDLPYTNHFNALAEYFQRCARWRARITARLRAERPQLIVVSSARAYDGTGAHTMAPGLKMYDTAWLRSLSQLVRQLRETGAQVLVLGPTPDPPAAIPLCLSGHLDDPTACSKFEDPAQAPGLAAELAATTAAGGQYAEVTDLFCAANRCPAIVGNTMVYFDAGHITREYSHLLAPAIGALADRALVGA